MRNIGQLGRLGWPVGLGRRDSTTASLSGANSDLPSPFLNLDGLIAAFQKKHFTVNEMVALSGIYYFIVKNNMIVHVTYQNYKK